MGKLLKLLGIVLAIPVLGALGLFAYAWVQLVFFALPSDGPRVVTTANYTFEAAEGWLTQCSDEAPGCLAVSTPPEAPVWKKRLAWIEVQPVDGSDVGDTAAFVQRANELALGLARDPAAAQLVRPTEEPFLFDGSEFFEVVNATDADYSRTAFVRFPDGGILRFTCRAVDSSQDAACAAALGRVRFPAAAHAAQVAAGAETARVAAEAEARRHLAARASAGTSAAPAPAPAPAPPAPLSWDETLDAVERAYQESKDGFGGAPRTPDDGGRPLDELLEGMD